MIAHEVFGARPDQLHRPTDMFGQHGNLRRYLRIKIPPETTACLHLDQRNIICIDPDSLGGSDACRLRCLRRQP